MNTPASKRQITLGVSLSTRACAQFDLSVLDVMKYAIEDLGIRRFRLMTYWDESESERGVYEFSSLASQLELAARYDCEVSLCLGLRQPRWPECHLPDWAKELDSESRNSAIRDHIRYIIKTFGDHPSISSYQLENEALNHGIGTCVDYDRSRLRREYKLVKKLAPSMPVVMSTSNSWGIPMRRPIPDIVGFSYYLYQWTDKGLSERHAPVWLHRMRRLGVRLLGREAFCHELQAEPWGDRGTEQLPLEQQLELMDATRIRKHLEYAQATGVSVIDLWGVEWWYSLPNEHKGAIDEVLRSFTLPS